MIARSLRQAASDARHAVRTIAATPWLSAVVVLSLAIGIGVNTVVFSWIQTRLLRPLPGVAGAERFYLIEPRTGGGLYPGTSWPEYEDLRGLDQLEEVIAFRSQPLYLGASTDVERISGQFVSPNYFAALGIEPVLGRLFGAGDGRTAAAEPVAVVSFGLWQSHLAGATDLAGRTLRVNGREVSVVGVAPASFQGTTLGLYFDVWLPAPAAPIVVSGSRELIDRSVRGYQLLARPRPGITQVQAQAQVTAAMARLATAHPLTNGSLTADVLRLSQAPRGPQRMAAYLLLLQGVMVLLFLAACVNVSNLLFARASARSREMGIRIALGGAPWRIASLILVESVMLALAGATLGALLAVWGTEALMSVPLTGLPIRFQNRVDATGLLLAAALGLIAGIGAAAGPALRLSRIDARRAFTLAADVARSRMREALMALQAAFALAVLIVAGLFVQSFLETRATDPGFRREGVLLSAYDLRGRAATTDAMRTFAGAVLDRLREEPSVAAVAIAASVPLDLHGLPLRMFSVEGRARADGTLDQTSSNTVTPGYFGVMGIPFRSGQDFTPLGASGGGPQAIVNDAFVARFLPGLQPLGRRVVARGRSFTIVGVVADSLSNAFGEPPTAVLYLSFRDSPSAFADIHVLTRQGSPESAAADVRRAIRAIDPGLPLFNVRTLEAHLESNLIFRRIPARMFAVLGPLLLLLVAIGIYANVAYSMTLRRKEIGIRLALGAPPARLIARVAGRQLATVGTGIGLGWIWAVLVVWRRATAVEDPAVTFVVAPAAILTVAAAACWIPARRAARLAPRGSMQEL